MVRPARFGCDRGVVRAAGRLRLRRGCPDGVHLRYGAGNLQYERLESRLVCALTVEWSTAVGGSGYEEARSAVPTDDGGYVLAGWTNGARKSKREDVFVTRLAADGSVVWTRSIGGVGSDRAYSIVRIGDEYLVGGTTRSFGPRQLCYLVRLDATGAILWDRTFGHRQSSGIRNLAVTSDGGFVATGWTGVRRNDDSNDLLLFRIDADGDLAWWREYVEPHWQLGHEVLEAPDGGFVIAGIARRATSGPGAIDLDGRVTKTDAMGKVQWALQTRRTGWDEWHGLMATANGYVVSGGAMMGRRMRTCMMQIDTMGTVIWSRVYSTSGYSWHVSQDGTGGFVCVGAAFTPLQIGRPRLVEDGSAFVLTVDRNGRPSDVGYFSSRYHDEARYVLPTPTGGILVVGYIGRERGIAPSSKFQPDWDRDVFVMSLRRSADPDPTGTVLIGT